MDSQSLRTASEYLNNLLLARGLLRNGEPVDFVRPSKESRAHIINLVHDLVLRNDRDKEAREQTAFSYRQLRAEEDQKTHEIERLQAKNEEASRSTVQAQTAERVAKEAVKKMEKSMRTLQEQSSKLKTALAQVKAQCTNDIRKRDLELARLKTHLQGQQRGNRSAPVAPSISISGDRSRPTFNASVRDVADPEYSLKQETNEFLTQLSSSLSDENDRLISMVRNAIETLRELLGLQTVLRGAADSGIGEDVIDRDGLFQTLPTNIESLTSELAATMTHLKALLTNPNFVSIEEVEVREEEIIRMRSDWEKMEQRWRDLLSMMAGWKKRMDTGGNINMDDLRRGMGLVSPGREERTSVGAEESDDCSLVDDSIEDLRNGTALAKNSTSHGSNSLDSGSLRNASTRRSTRIPQAQARFKPQDLDRGGPKRKRDPLDPPESFDLRPRGTPFEPNGMSSSEERLSHHDDAVASARLDELDDEESEELEIPRMTIEEKLSAVADEAAAVRDRMHHSNLLRPRSVAAASLDGSADNSDAHDEDTLGKMPTPHKRTRIRGKPRRRKSTLSRDELAELLLEADGKE